MSTRLNTRIATLEKTMNPKAGIADTIRKLWREMANGIVRVGCEVGGPIANAIRKARAEKAGKAGL